MYDLQVLPLNGFHGNTCQITNMGVGVKGRRCRLRFQMTAWKFSREACLSKQSACGGNWVESMLSFLAQNNLYLISLMLSVPG